MEYQIFPFLRIREAMTSIFYIFVMFCFQNQVIMIELSFYGKTFWR